MSDTVAGKELLVTYERALARKLALEIFDRPRPQIWMILVPLFFVFFIQKIRQYSSGLEDFVDNYMRPRLAALDIAAASLSDRDGAERIEELARQVPENVRPLFVDWMTMLTDHYRELLQTGGADVGAMIRGAYRTRTDYLLWCNVLNRTENSYNLALMPAIDGEQDDVGSIISRMHDSLTRLRREDAEAVYR